MHPEQRPGFQLRPASSSEAAALTSIASAAKRSWGYPETWLEAWSEQLTVSAEFIANVPTFVARHAGDILGWGAVRVENTDAHLDHLWVKPAAMHHGVGTALFQHAETLARDAAPCVCSF